MPPDGALDEFANTFTEWHYLAGGAALGWLACDVSHFLAAAV